MARLSCLAAMLISLAAPTASAQRAPLNIEAFLADNYAMMRDFGRCSVLYAGHAQMAELSEASARAEEIRGRAREAKAAAETAFANVKAPANASTEEMRKVEATIAVYTKSLESIMALETTRQAAFWERREWDIEQMNFCSRKRTQKIIVDKLRKEGIFSSSYPPWR